MVDKVCFRNKFGYCKWGEICRYKNIHKICENRRCETFHCDRRHLKECYWFREFKRCKFSPCSYRLTPGQFHVKSPRKKRRSFFWPFLVILSKYRVKLGIWNHFWPKWTKFDHFTTIFRFSWILALFQNPMLNFLIWVLIFNHLAPKWIHILLISQNLINWCRFFISKIF